MDVSQVGLRFRCIEVLVLVVVKVIFQPRLAVALSRKIFSRCHSFLKHCFDIRELPPRSRTGEPRFPYASTNDRRRRRVKVDRAVADTKTEDEEGVPKDDDRSKKYDARRRFKIRDVDRDVNSCFFPFFTNDSSRDESNAPRTGWFAAPSARRKFHSVNVACFLRQHARGAVRGAVLALVAVYGSFKVRQLGKTSMRIEAWDIIPTDHPRIGASTTGLDVPSRGMAIFSKLPWPKKALTHRRPACRRCANS